MVAAVDQERRRAERRNAPGVGGLAAQPAACLGEIVLVGLAGLFGLAGVGGLERYRFALGPPREIDDAGPARGQPSGQPVADDDRRVAVPQWFRAGR